MGMNNLPVILAGEAIHTSDKDLSGNTIAAVVFTGLAVVFIALVILIALVSLYGKIFETVNKKKEQKAAEAKAAEAKKAAETAPAKKPEKAAAPVVQDGIEEETVAVIMAAVAAYGAQSGKKLAVKSIKAQGAGSARRNAWSAAGIAESTRPF